MTYKVEYFQRHAEGASHHTTNKLEQLLNERAEKGWMLDKIQEVSIGYLLIFKKL